MPAHSSLSRFFRLLLWLFVAGVGMQSPSWALTRAGTSIDNRALAAYTDTETGLPAILQSNIVSAEVQPLEALALAPNQAVQSPPGSPLTLAHRLTNTGNTPSRFQIGVANSGGDNFDIADLKVFLDSNDNGLVDVGEPEVSGPTAALDMGASVSLIITGKVPSDALPDTSAQIKLTATSVEQGERASNTDTVSITKKFSLKLFKAASLPAANAGDSVTFTLSALNSGTSSPSPIKVTVDGGERELILVRDAIPVNTSLAAFNNNGSGLALYHRLGDPEISYLSRAPQDLSTVDAIA